MALRLLMLWLSWWAHGTADSSAEAEPKTSIAGDLASWRVMFNAEAPELLSKDLVWAEGPVWTDEGLLFSDTVTGTMWRWREERLEEFLSSAGGCESTGDCDPEQAEPGSNGMAMVSNDSVAVCQHGGRRLALMNLRSKEISALVGEFQGKRLNGPNDVVLHKSGDLFFTDPYYAFLEKSRFYDDNYTDAKSDLGFAGVYRLTKEGELKLLDSSTSRPNGLAWIPGSPQKLVVSECCQGHSPKCPQGLARWKVFELNKDLEKVKFLHNIERRAAPEYLGCADGFKVHPNSGLIVSSCPQGLCVVDLKQKRVTVKLHMGRKTSNVAFGGGYMWITGERRLWRIPLAGEVRAKHEL